MVAGLLVIAGVAVPHLDDESISTLLFLAGTGLTAVLIKTPWPPFANRRSTAPSPAAPMVATARKSEPAAFAELISRQGQPALDRAAWAKLTAHMSHELRTPLNAVLGFSEMMSNEVFGPLGSSLYSSYVRDIHASGRLLLKSAEDALAITSLLTAERKTACTTGRLAETIADASAFAEADLRSRSVAIDVSVDPSIEVIGEPQALRQTFVNLLAEAGRNADDHTAIHVTARAHRDSVRVLIEASGSTDAVVATSDNFHVMLARTLCELSGAKLVCEETAGPRQWLIDFLPATQDTFVF
jgi:signal transduction histidine kinase